MNEKINELFASYFEDIEVLKRAIQHNPNTSKQEWLKYIYGKISVYSHILDQYISNIDCDAACLRIPLTKRLRKRYSYKAEGSITKFEAMMNKICYNLDVKEKDYYNIVIEPLYCIKIANHIFPVYDDDPGQCLYMRLDEDHIFCCAPWSYDPDADLLFELIANYMPWALRKFLK